MPGRLKIHLMIAAAWIPCTLLAQHPGSYPQMIEELLYKNETSSIPEEIYDRLEESEQTILHLNTASQEQLEASGLFTPFQLHQLIRYRERFGAIYTIFELAALPGFKASDLLDLEPRFELIPELAAPGKKRPKHMVMIDVKKKHPESMAYRASSDNGGEKAYVGSPISTTLRIRSQTGSRLSLGLTYEKDAGEKAFDKGRPQYFSAYLLYQGNRFLKQLVVGTFQLNHGLGLVNGTGFFHHPSSLKINYRTLSLLRPYASKTEHRFERGVACRMAWNKFQYLIWASYTHQDLSTASLIGNPGEIRWWEHQRTSGLHRSDAELEGRDLASRISGGIQLQYRHREFALGLMTGTERMAITKKGETILGKSYEPFLHQTASLFGTWFRGRWQLSGELAVDGGPSLACQVVYLVQFNDFLRGTLVAHHYGTEYRGSLPSSYSSGSHVRNEQGLAFHLHMEPGPKLLIDVTGELSNYPSPRYQSLVPSRAYRIHLSLQNPGTNPLQWRISLASKARQSTPASTTVGIRPLQESRVTRLDGRLVHKTGRSFTWQSRLVISFLSTTKEAVPAYATLQQTNFQLTPYLHCTLQFVLFHVRDWDNRIYLYEPGFYYSFNFPSYYGSGQKSTVLLTIKAIKGFTLSAKISEINYFDREDTGSGKDMVKGNKLWETGLQVRLKF